MDSSNADPWEGFTGQSQADADDALIMDPLVRQISELRAALADSEARRAELEAFREKVFGAARENAFDGEIFYSVAHIEAALAETPSTLLEDRDREVAARAVEGLGQQIVDVIDVHYLVEDKNLGYYRTEVTCACGESWWYGEHEGDPSRQEMWDKHRVEAITVRAAAIRKGDTMSG